MFFLKHHFLGKSEMSFSFGWDPFFILEDLLDYSQYLLI